MSSSAPTPPRELTLGVKALGSEPQCSVLSELTFDFAKESWLLSVALQISEVSTLVSQRSAWILVIDKGYPIGSIGVYPALKDGIASTFPHQARNILEGASAGWRSGKLCLDTPFGRTMDRSHVNDPIGDAEGRLLWHIRRSIAWLTAAARQELLAIGDPFELPQRPSSSTYGLSASRIVHDESATTYSVWRNRTGFGRAKLVPLYGIDSTLIVRSFMDLAGSTIREWTGRSARTEQSNEIAGIWWIWPQPIVLAPWECPATWGGLRSVSRALRLDLDTILRQVARLIRGKPGPTILLLGYPIPDHIGNEPSEMHWDALLLPQLEAGIKQTPGFRANEMGWWIRDRRTTFSDGMVLKYVSVENWSEDRIQARGRLPVLLRDCSIAIVGAGALGSVVAELLVRMGLRHLKLIDQETLAAGNVVRHVLTLSDVDLYKADALRIRLLKLSPHVDVVTSPSRMPTTAPEVHTLLDPYDIVIDCTASNEVLASLALPWWSVPKHFLSLSVGVHAQRLFAFSTFSNQFVKSDFDGLFDPWLQDEATSWAREPEFSEGAGCWSPLMPARHDDITMAACVCLKFLEATVTTPRACPRLLVFEQQTDDLGYSGFSRIEKQAKRVDLLNVETEPGQLVDR